MKTSLKFKKFASFAKLLKSRLAGRGRSDTSTVASNNDLILDLSKWEKVDVSDCMSNFDLFLLRHSITLSYTLGYSASIIMWWWVEAIGFQMNRIIRHDWLAIFAPIIFTIVLILLHEGWHYVFSNRAISEFGINIREAYFAVIFRGEYSKSRLLLGTLAPTIFISMLVLPACLFDSPYLMLLVIVNLAGSGSDWISAYFIFRTVKTRVWLTEEASYFPIETRSK